MRDGGKDNITKEGNKIIIRVKYTFGNKEDEITLDINKKEVGLKNILANIVKSLKEMFFMRQKKLWKRQKKKLKRQKKNSKKIY